MINFMDRFQAPLSEWSQSAILFSMPAVPCWTDTVFSISLYFSLFNDVMCLFFFFMEEKTKPVHIAGNWLYLSNDLTCLYTREVCLMWSFETNSLLSRVRQRTGCQLWEPVPKDVPSVVWVMLQSYGTWCQCCTENDGRPWCFQHFSAVLFVRIVDFRLLESDKL